VIASAVVILPALLMLGRLIYLAEKEERRK